MKAARFFEKKLLEYFKKSGREHLPWRASNITPYEVWVSEIMLQQTQVSRVIPYFEKFIRRFPTIFDLAAASWEEFLPYYTGLGYYRRGRNMLATARTIVSDFGGEFPQILEELKSLPGVGEYTASAIMSFAFGKNIIALDTNIRRVLGRFFHGFKTAEIDTVFFEKNLLAGKRDLNAAMMDFANDICLGQKPRCSVCPLRSRCVYVRQNGQNEIVLKKQRDAFPVQQARVHLWLHREHKEYYSAHPDRFEVFRLPIGVVSRDEIKKYFREHYGLELAVRPPHRKIFIQEKLVLYVNAQILLGEPEFAVFRREEIKKMTSAWEQRV